MQARLKKVRSGFTLIELLAVCACIALLLVVFSYAIIAAQERARIALCAMNLRQSAQAYSAYAMNNENWYPLVAIDNTRYRGMGTWKGPGYPTGALKVSLLPFLWKTPGGKLPNDDPNPFEFPKYLSDFRTLYCPNTTKGKGFNTAVAAYAYNKVASQWDIHRYPPDIGYSAPNGNSPGYYSWSPSYQYFGKRIEYPGSPGNFAADSTADHFAAGFIHDAPNTIIMADIAMVKIADNTWDLDGLDEDSETLNVSHRGGMNVLYNDGRVAFSTFQDKVVLSQYYYTNLNSSINLVFGPK